MSGYCFDTSAFIEGWIRLYPKDIFPDFWKDLESMCEDGRILCPDEVLREIQKQEDDLHKWLKARKNLFAPLSVELQRSTTEVLDKYPHLVKGGANQHVADPFVVAFAKLDGRTVVTQEQGTGSARKPKIPGICRDYGIPCIGLLAWMREQKWIFIRANNRSALDDRS